MYINIYLYIVYVYMCIYLYVFMYVFVTFIYSFIHRPVHYLVFSVQSYCLTDESSSSSSSSSDSEEEERKSQRSRHELILNTSNASKYSCSILAQCAKLGCRALYHKQSLSLKRVNLITVSSFIKLISVFYAMAC